MNLHTQTENYILNKISSGDLKVGDQIPTEAELAVLIGASRTTIRQALNRLTTKGYLIRIKGRGSFITQPKLLHQSTTFISSYRNEMENEKKVTFTKVLDLEVIKPDMHVAEKLMLAKGKQVTKLTRLRTVEGYNNGKPALLTTVYIPFDKFKHMSEIDFIDKSLYDLLAKENLEVAHANKELEVCLPDETASKLLKISRFEPVIIVSSVGLLADKTPIEYSESMYPAECSKFNIEIHK